MPLPLYTVQTLTAYAINSEIANSGLSPGKSATAALSLNASDARGLAAIPSGTISYDNFHGTFQLYNAYEGYYGSYGYQNYATYPYGSVSSLNVNGHDLIGLWWNGGTIFNPAFTAVTIQSASNLGTGYWTSLTVGGLTAYSSSTTAFYQAASPGYTIWSFGGDVFNLTNPSRGGWLSCKFV